MKRMLFVMNPYAGQKKANRHLPEIIGIFNRAGFEVVIHMTECQGDAAQVVQQRAKDVDLVVCCGGDGTFNEAMSGLLRSGVDVPIGYIPAGSTNDFAASLKLPTSILAAARNVVNGKPVRYDVGKFGDRYFSYVASFGAFTHTSYATPQSVKNALGHTAYLLAGIQELSQIRKVHIRMELDDEIIEDDYLFGAVSNSTSMGGVLTLNANQVDMRDGLFEVLLIRAPRTLAELPECILAMQTQNYDHCGMITFRSVKKVKIFADPTMLWTLDGEREDGHGEVLVENLHHAVQLIQEVKENG